MLSPSRPSLYVAQVQQGQAVSRQGEEQPAREQAQEARHDASHDSPRQLPLPTVRDARGPSGEP